jgi:hypothetical protein
MKIIKNPSTQFCHRLYTQYNESEINYSLKVRTEFNHSLYFKIDYVSQKSCSEFSNDMKLFMVCEYL